MTALVRTTIRLLAALLAAAAPAHAAVPPDIESRILHLAADWRTNEATQSRLAQMSGNPHSGGIAASLNRRVSTSLISQAVMDAISRDPADATDAVALAVRAAPRLENDIRTNLAQAYPALAGDIWAAGRAPPRPPPAATVASRPQPAPAHAAPPPADRGDARDPAEGFNRAIFAVNDVLDTYLIAPVARAYRWAMPQTLREMGRNFFENFNEPVVAINDALQGDLESAGTSVARFAVNSTIGILGFFEVANRIDLAEHPADFGQTLHSYGVGAGPYVVLPLLGPSTARDTAGDVVDIFLNPIGYFLDFETRLYMKAVEELLVKREAALDATDELRKSPDYYAATRAGWFARREIELRKQLPEPWLHRGSSAPDAN